MYYCELCNYETEDKDRINLHHIIPKSLKGSDKMFNRVYLCPNCHARIFCEGTKGSHGVRGINPIIINGKLLSTGGLIIDFIEEGNQKYSNLKNEY